MKSGQKKSSGAGTQTEQNKKGVTKEATQEISHDSGDNASTLSLPFNLSHELMIQVATLQNAGIYPEHLSELKQEWFSSNPGAKKIFEAFSEYAKKFNEAPLQYDTIQAEAFSDPRDYLEASRTLQKFKGSEAWANLENESRDKFPELKHELEQLFKRRKFWEKMVGDPSEAYRREQQSATHDLKMNLGSIFYDSGRSRYLTRNERGGYMALTDARLKRHLKSYGFIDSRPEGDKGTPAIDYALTQIERENNIDWSGELAGYRPGPHSTGNGIQILVTGQARIAEPEERSFKFLDNFFKGLLGEGEQLQFFYAWAGVALRQLLKGQLATGPAVALVGPPDCGKTLFKLVLTEIFGGRSAAAGRYLRGATEFNAELFRSELWTLDDEISPKRYKDRQNLGDFIKKVVADPTDSIHSKGKDAIPVKVWRRLLICCNDDSDSLQILPPLTGSENLGDKLAILKAHVCELPPTETDSERSAFWEKVFRCLPGFIHHVTTEETPEHMRSRRWGVKVIQNSEIVQTLIEDQPDQILHRVIQKNVTHTIDFTGTADELLATLKQIMGPEAQAVDDLNLTSRGTGRLLQTLCDQKPGHYSFKRTNSGRFYHIKPSGDVR